MYTIKLQKRAEHGGEEFECFPAVHYASRKTPADCLAVREGLASPGIEIELRDARDNALRTIHLPSDGDAVFVMDSREGAKGNTVEIFRWSGGAR